MIKLIFAFIAGALVGSASGYAVCRRLCEKEIQSVKEMYGARSVQPLMDEPKQETVRRTETNPKALKKAEVERINKILDDMDYNKNVEQEDDTVKPFQINPDEFGEDEAYGQAMLDYYLDGTIVDDEDCVLTNISIKNLVGTGVGDMFDQTDEDVIYIRNPTVMIDYMITRVDEPYYKDDQT